MPSPIGMGVMQLTTTEMPSARSIGSIALRLGIVGSKMPMAPTILEGQPAGIPWIATIPSSGAPSIRLDLTTAKLITSATTATTRSTGPVPTCATSTMTGRGFRISHPPGRPPREAGHTLVSGKPETHRGGPSRPAGEQHDYRNQRIVYPRESYQV
jgi:hypothetical protein